MDDGTKACGKCGDSLPTSAFHRDRRRKDDLYPWCKLCRRNYYGQQPHQPRKHATKAEYDKDYRAALSASERRERTFRSWLWSTYRMAPEDYLALLARQGGVCAICASGDAGPSTSKFGTDKQRFSVDHDHRCCPGDRSCGDCVRGLLCGPCNRGVGIFRDSPHTLRAAASYLEAWCRTEAPLFEID